MMDPSTFLTFNSCESKQFSIFTDSIFIAMEDFNCYSVKWQTTQLTFLQVTPLQFSLLQFRLGQIRYLNQYFQHQYWVMIGIHLFAIMYCTVLYCTFLFNCVLSRLAQFSHSGFIFIFGLECLNKKTNHNKTNHKKMKQSDVSLR